MEEKKPRFAVGDFVFAVQTSNFGSMLEAIGGALPKGFAEFVSAVMKQGDAESLDGIGVGLHYVKIREVHLTSDGVRYVTVEGIHSEDHLFSLAGDAMEKLHSIFAEKIFPFIEGKK